MAALGGGLSVEEYFCNSFRPSGAFEKFSRDGYRGLTPPAISFRPFGTMTVTINQGDSGE